MTSETPPEPALGELDPASLRAFDEKWRRAFEPCLGPESAARPECPDLEAARALARVPEGAEVVVVLGTWCGDSRREVSRLARALDEAARGRPALPFRVRWLGVDRGKASPGEVGREIAGLGVRYVPTVIVRRDGVEVGRVVESAPEGIERALAAYLGGGRTGVTSGRPELAPASR